ncbi:S8 family serine peptidase [Massilia sp. erpn]|uniref:S8 family serine peptidase n=1 Tax=Massilia sp. erpn TaxID=2738142 RepID=UPI00210569D5|nr:S8 family serine peptidase [Massilia sp. erpn]UTY55768.1 S8 family peptidase [Massilia sp. erpn]
MKLRPISLAVLALLSSAALHAGADEIRRSYIVQLADKPVASYGGEVSGLAATRPAPGRRLDVSAADVQAYIVYLEQKKNGVTASVPTAQIGHHYKLAFNGFSARLTEGEVRQLQKSANVAAISVDEERQPSTNFTPIFLGLDKPGTGLWDQVGGRLKAGEDMIIGVVDGGVWPENPAYADRVDANGVPTFDPAAEQVYGPAPAGWLGECQTGEGFSSSHCNNKLIGARYFNAGFIATGRPMHWTDFVSPRDSVAGPSGHGSHGTHTSTTAGGNAKVPGKLGGIPVGDMSGVAPRARLAAYKVCWTYPDATNPDGSGTRNSCFDSDSVAAIEQAVQDGVHVINYSISGTQNNINDPVELAFFGASNAGVFVAASAGNSGPANTVAHISPWVTTVAASTHNRFGMAKLSLANGASYDGASLAAKTLPATPTVLAANAGVKPYASLSSVDQTALTRCYTAEDRALYGGSADAALDLAKATGKVLVCDRGSSARVDKSRAVGQVGGVGMILVDVSSATTIEADLHSVPTVHLKRDDGIAVKAWVAANPDGGASIGKATLQSGPAAAPVMGAFSSRGPNKHNANVLKPDLTAPGLAILAGGTPAQSEAERDAIANGTLTPQPEWIALQGTSMSSPHVAGLAALLKQLHPDWSPAAIKSALMTTAYDTKPDGLPGMQAGTLPWAQGAGHVAANSAADPGLVYDAGTIDYLRFMCGISGTLSPTTCGAVGAIQPHNLNLASLTAATVLGKITLNRSVTNVGSSEATYTANASVPGFKVTVTPAQLTLAPGAKASFSVTLTNNGAVAGAWNYGALTWTDGKHVVRSPLTARLAAVSAPSVLSGNTSSGNVAFTVGSGYTGALVTQKGGLQAATRATYTVLKTGNTDSAAVEAACKAGGDPGVRTVDFDVPANTLAARFALYDVETSGYQAGQPDDLDMLVLGPNGQALANSGNATSNESVTLPLPAAGTYRVCVVGYAPTNGRSTYTLSSWLVGNGLSEGGFKVNTPALVYNAGTAAAGVSWSGLGTARHLGAIVYLANNAPQAISYVEVDTTNPLPTSNAQRETPPNRQ